MLKCKRFVTVFCNATETHLTKDVGQIPYFLSKHFGYRAILVSANPIPSVALQGKTPTLAAEELPRFFGMNSQRVNFLRQLLYILVSGPKIDILNLYQLSMLTKISAILFKLRNGKGVVYVKLDGNQKEMERIIATRAHRRNTPKTLLNRFAIRYVDIVSAETDFLAQSIAEIYPGLAQRTVMVPNAVDNEAISDLTSLVDFTEKRNLMLTVGRLDHPVKNVKLLLNSLSHITDLRDWQIVLIGPVTDQLKSHFDALRASNPKVFGSVHLLGEITDRSVLYKWYNDAKVFILTSNSEGFPLVYVEAAYFGNYIVSTDVGVARDFIGKSGIGTVIPVNDEVQLARTLRSLVEDDHWYSAHVYQRIVSHARAYNWESVIRPLNDRLTRAGDKFNRGEV